MDSPPLDSHILHLLLATSFGGFDGGLGTGFASGGRLEVEGFDTVDTPHPLPAGGSTSLALGLTGVVRFRLFTSASASISSSKLDATMESVSPYWTVYLVHSPLEDTKRHAGVYGGRHTVWPICSMLPSTNPMHDWSALRSSS